MRGVSTFLALACAIGATFGSALAGPLQQASVSKIVNEVKVVEPKVGARPAVVDDMIKGETGVRTGAESRTELLFQDATLTRLGSETYFSFVAGTRDLKLERGTMLLQVPKNLGGTKIRTAAVTAAITGTTIMMEYIPGKHTKVVVLEGSLRLELPGRWGQSVLLEAGKMVLMKNNAKTLPTPVDVDLRKLMKTSSLIDPKLFRGKTRIAVNPLPSEGLIAQEIAKQDKLKGGSELIDTNLLIKGSGNKVTVASDGELASLGQKAPGSAVNAPGTLDQLIGVNNPASPANPLTRPENGGQLGSATGGIRNEGPTAPSADSLIKLDLLDVPATMLAANSPTGNPASTPERKPLGATVSDTTAALIAPVTNTGAAAPEVLASMPEVTKTVPTVVSSIAPAVAAAVPAIVNAVPEVVSAVPAIVNAVPEVVSSVPAIVNTVPEVVSAVPAIVNAVPEVVSSVPAIVNAVPEVVSSVPAIVNAVPEVVSSVPAIVNTVPEVVSAVPAIVNAVPEVVSSVPAIVNAVPEVVSAVPAIVNAVPEVVSAVPAIVNTVPEVVSSVPAIVNAVPEVVSSVPAIVNTVPEVVSAVPAIVNAVPEVVSAVPAIVNAVPEVVSAVPAIVNAVPEVVSSVPVIVNAVPEVVSSVPAIVNTVPEVVSAVPAIVNSVPDVVSAVPAIVNAVPEVVSSVPAIVNSVPDVVSSAPAIVNTVPEVVSSLPAAVGQTVPEVVSSVPAVVEAIPEVVASVPEIVSNLPLAGDLLGAIPTAPSTSTPTAPTESAPSTGLLGGVLNTVADLTSPVTTPATTQAAEPELPSAGQVLETSALTAGQALQRDGANGSLLSGPSAGESFELRGPSLEIATTSVNGISARGGNATGLGQKGGDGGVISLGTTVRPIAGSILVNAPITATTGTNSLGVSTGGKGGTVNLVANGPITVRNRIQVSESAGRGASAQGGNINIESRATGQAIVVENSAQLLALLSSAAPGPGGTIRFSAPNGDISIKDSTVRADRGTITLQTEAANGTIQLQNVNLRGDVVKAVTMGTDGRLIVGGGTIDADSAIKLYATGSRGEVQFVDNVTLKGSSTKTIAGYAVTINNGKTVTIGGSLPAQVFTDKPNYRGSGGNGSTTGKFGGAGAITKPFGQRPAY